MRKSTLDFLCGLSFLLISTVFGMQLTDLEGVSSIFPSALLVVIALGGIWFVGKGLWLRHKESTSCNDEPVAWAKVAIISVFSLIYVSFIMLFGFFSSTFIFIAGSSIVLGDKSQGIGHAAKAGLIYGVIFCLLLWASFVKLLNVPTPTGLFF
uniref:DUF1468 domain-containing protein n=1 Tax=Desulfovibrio desulfuricans (strain ATCC 27774 / DSM 6949 / MB) TaxID=525146 RepID=B8IYJ8_DESDA